MIRTNNTSDIQECIIKFLDSLASPWSDWDIVHAWRDLDLVQAESKALVYVEDPIMSGELIQAGGIARNNWSMIIGFWVTRDKGGPDEISIWSSNMISLFQNPQTIKNTQFTVVIAGTTYANTTLAEQGIGVVGIGSQRDIDTDDINEFRREFEVFILA